MKKITLIITIFAILILYIGTFKALQKNQTDSIENNNDIYIYTYKDLWIKATIHDKIKKSWNKIYNNINPLDFIEVFFKDPKKSFEDEIKENHLPEWCKIETRIDKWGHPISRQTKWFQVIGMISIKDISKGEDLCMSPDWWYPILFYMDPDNPEKYYKISYGDCAPGPCSIFKNIEFF